jgi:acetyltransferase EpsM
MASVFDIPVFNSGIFETLSDKSFIIAVGNNMIRKKIVEKVDGVYKTAIHPQAIVSRFAAIDEGTVVMAGAIINADAAIGKHCIINTAAIIEHDCILGDYVHISPNAALGGAVEIAEGAHIGIGATVIQGIKIGRWATIGAGTVIINDIPDYAVVVGNPGKILKYHTKHEQH